MEYASISPFISFVFLFPEPFFLLLHQGVLPPYVLFKITPLLLLAKNCLIPPHFSCHICLMMNKVVESWPCSERIGLFSYVWFGLSFLVESALMVLLAMSSPSFFIDFFSYTSLLCISLIHIPLLMQSSVFTLSPSRYIIPIAAFRYPPGSKDCLFLYRYEVLIIPLLHSVGSFQETFNQMAVASAKYTEGFELVSTRILLLSHDQTNGPRALMCGYVRSFFLRFSLQ